mmetsp:Transcript_9534/g.13308  ORF Transcript_9534/g.13308 Transcript_9534/m.13308 type:complete len:129 (-) Transcript_9534:234-620(-)|eukprot:CAMPEP_0185724124 /NCGR_PEP_ID=MMETSP1171-20130828/696_1 /TAXON_ID=374046 /ORGANISM="Helicotheca tamensis, Strain CCMP826" /LENGTH=128 /DNA_ID=CAMNT_0028391909 /DNA_START=403 /DNA_END=789 /DNA_ORIENTATION=+
MDGVVRTVVGYTGGSEPNPTYTNIRDATEAILIEFDPSIITYEDILNEWSNQHSPYFNQKTQYRSAIFYRNEMQQKVALEKLDALKDKAEVEDRNVFVSVEEVGPFYKAEEYHQDFLTKQTRSRWLQI